MTMPNHERELYDLFKKNAEIYDISTVNKDRYNVKRGLRNADGTGVLAGLTKICNVHGYVLDEHEKTPIDGELIYRGYNVRDLIGGVENVDRYGFEEVAYLLLLGELPNKEQLDAFNKVLETYRVLPEFFFEDAILKTPSKEIMNKLGATILAQYTYDEDPEASDFDKEVQVAMRIIARMPSLIVYCFQAMNRHYNRDSIIMHRPIPGESTAQTILSLLRTDRQYTKEEAYLLDLCLMLHAEHGGGNNSTFAVRVLTSSGSDAYAAYSAGVGSLKGHRHGGANSKIMQMLDFIENDVKNWEDREEVAEYLRKILRKEAGDKSGLIYGMGHAIYTLSDPRAVLLKRYAMDMAKGTEFEAEFKLLQLVEDLTPIVFSEVTGSEKVICANVDMYSGLVYKMLGIPKELNTPIFAVSRMAGWCAHRLEELMTCKRIMRPAYKAIQKARNYTELSER